MEKKIYSVISKILGVPIKDLNEQSSPETIEGWESLKHMNLVIALEEEFDVQFEDDEIVNLLNIKNIIQILQRKI